MHVVSAKVRGGVVGAREVETVFRTRSRHLNGLGERQRLPTTGKVDDELSYCDNLLINAIFFCEILPNRKLPPPHRIRAVKCFLLFDKM